jgi:hypothetical protein
MKRLQADLELKDSSNITDTLVGAFPQMKRAMLRQMTELIFEEANKIIYRAVGYDMDNPNEAKYIEAKETLKSLSVTERGLIAQTAIKELVHNKRRVQQLLDKAKQEKRIII